MNDESQTFFISVDANEPNIHIDRRLCDLFPDQRICAVMPREQWPSYRDMNLAKAEISIHPETCSILVSGFDLAGQLKEERTIELQTDQPDNMRYQIQYALGQLGAIPLSNGNCSGTIRPTLNIAS